MRAARLTPLLVVVAALLAACQAGAGAPQAASTGPGPTLDPRSGGMTTTFRSGADSFGRPARNFARYEDQTFADGKPRFNEAYTVAGGDRPGLGPRFNADSCLSCHVGHAGGVPPDGQGDPGAGLLVKLTGVGTGDHGQPNGDPVYGDQLRDHAVAGAEPDGQVHVEWTERTGTFADGTPYSLRSPRWSVEGLTAGPLAPATSIAPRLAPPVIGLGLLEAIPEADVVAGADPDDADRDGIRGRVNRVWDLGRADWSLGRFGWKAGQPTVEQQSAGALRNDMGLTSPLYDTAGCAPGDTACQQGDPTAAGDPARAAAAELGLSAMYELTLYTRTLAVPAARDTDDPAVQAGSQVFDRIGCADCHTRTFTTGADAVGALTDQTIHPYTDLLVHDMGPELADGRTEYEAGPADYRTPPLWGLGLRPTVTGPGVGYLHDGRARSVQEAILWHGGEAQAVRDRFAQLSADDRAALLRFLDSL